MHGCKQFKPWILSDPAPFLSGIEFNFLLTSSCVIIISFLLISTQPFCSLVLLIHSASCLCSTLVLDVTSPDFVAYSALEDFSLSDITSNLLKLFPGSCWNPDLLKLFNSVVILFYFSVSCCYNLF